MTEYERVRPTEDTGGREAQRSGPKGRTSANTSAPLVANSAPALVAEKPFLSDMPCSDTAPPDSLRSCVDDNPSRVHAGGPCVFTTLHDSDVFVPADGCRGEERVTTEPAHMTTSKRVAFSASSACSTAPVASAVTAGPATEYVRVFGAQG